MPDSVALARIFEAIMLICFGTSWPISIIKMLRTRQVAGKSLLFLVIIFTGYMSGIAYKLVGTRDNVLFLYILNAAMVAIDITLYLRFSRQARALAQTKPAA